MKINNLFKYLAYSLIVFKFFLPISKAFSEDQKKQMCDNPLIDYISLNDDRNYEYLEKRNDSGIFFDIEWNSENKDIEIKRDKNDYPIVRYSLFDNKNFLPGKTSIKKINSINLSNQSDENIKKLTYLSGETNFELSNGKKISINSGNYKLNNFKLSSFEILSIQEINGTTGILEMSFNAKFTNQRNDLLDLLKDSNLLDDSLHPVCLQMRRFNDWPIGSIELDEFKYDADVREGLKNKELLINPVLHITYDDGIVRTLREESGVGFFRQSFNFEKFPFDNQKLIIRIKSGDANFKDSNLEFNDGFGSITFVTPEPGAFIKLNKFLNKKINKLKAWQIPENGIDIVSNVIVEKDHYDIYTKNFYDRYESVLDIEIAIERNFKHYVFKIMLPVFLILCVAWYVLWIPTAKYEARLNTSIIALLALIAYNFVFQDDIPKLEYLTDLDWFILVSYIFCCLPVFLSIAFSKFISKNQRMVIKINKLIRYWGGFLYLFLNLMIFDLYK